MSDCPPLLVHRPRATLPLVVSVPHAGRDYSSALVALARQGKPALAALEDPLVDRLVWRLLKLGAGAVIARAPRAMIDCNRSEEDLDPASVSGVSRAAMSPRARGGLGLIPSRTRQHGSLWTRQLSIAEAEARIDGVHRPYHEAIEAMLAETVELFGCALLLDCHSMPPAPGLPGIVIGDLHGRSANRWLGAMALDVAEGRGFSGALNEPYAGGHVVDRHGRPGRNVHAIQIEINRNAYLDPMLRAPGPGFDEVAKLFEAIGAKLGGALLDRQLAAAE